jgi:hypothetical protein
VKYGSKATALVLRAGKGTSDRFICPFNHPIFPTSLRSVFKDGLVFKGGALKTKFSKPKIEIPKSIDPEFIRP